MILIGLGGMLGAAGRYMVGNYFKRENPDATTGTWLVNIAGSYILGVLAAAHVSGNLSEWIWYFMGIGFCGAFTTFSTFSVEVMKMLQSEHWRKAVHYITSSVLLGLVAATAGFFLLK
ncbi:fluoride efflux transporter CrcB [Pseudalkalibacillus sp. SCS-8]|uniref:fluoride efflux transporter CrcB n=1 Tax=Pseudalkalibacillus nanhaiensis TaxID=3115291 RepID=UPI0032DAC6B1